MSCWQFQHFPHAIGNGTTTLSPTFRFFTDGPVSTTSPMNSCPRMSPCCIDGMNPLYKCRSDPQIAVDDTLMIASFELRICGSGTFETFTCFGPSHVVAFMTVSPSHCVLKAAPDEAYPARRWRRTG